MIHVVFSLVHFEIVFSIMYLKHLNNTSTFPYISNSYILEQITNIQLNHKIFIPTIPHLTNKPPNHPISYKITCQTISGRIYIPCVRSSLLNAYIAWNHIRNQLSTYPISHTHTYLTNHAFMPYPINSRVGLALQQSHPMSHYLSAGRHNDYLWRARSGSQIQPEMSRSV